MFSPIVISRFAEQEKRRGLFFEWLMIWEVGFARFRIIFKKTGDRAPPVPVIAF
jgi:hypothetical protein